MSFEKTIDICWDGTKESANKIINQLNLDEHENLSYYEVDYSHKELVIVTPQEKHVLKPNVEYLVDKDYLAVIEPGIFHYLPPTDDSIWLLCTTHLYYSNKLHLFDPEIKIKQINPNYPLTFYWRDVEYKLYDTPFMITIDKEHNPIYDGMLNKFLKVE